MTDTRSHTREVLYCRATGRRIPPERGRVAQSDSPLAIAVLDDGRSIPIFGDTVLGRMPSVDPRVLDGHAAPLIIDDERKAVSRCHLLLRRRRRRFEAVDLGSRNGTAVATADRQWTSLMPGIGTTIEHGQELRLGSRTVTIHYVQL